MSYKVNFMGGTHDGFSSVYPEKIGGYVRMTLPNGDVEEYHRLFGNDEDGYYGFDAP